MNNTDKVDVVIKGMTREQALTFAGWYEGQGEQDQCEWFDIHDVKAPMTNCQRAGGYKENTDAAVIIYVK